MMAPKNRKELVRKTAIAFALMVGLLFVLEIIAIPLSYRDSGSESTAQEDFSQKFASKWIFENLTEEEKGYLIQNQKTVATYYYTTSPDFFELESLVSQFQGQVILQRQKSDRHEVELVSRRETVFVDNLTQEKIFAGLCQVLILPPPDCSSIEY
ncbi:MAG: hypothetical protein JW727_00675 [Candidatus Aenigmarchaeota archaeon]|nr:hypothetical protein [Candidatus Aenigmarchaeota archaeon]